VTVRPAPWFEAARGEGLLRQVLGVGSLRAFDLEPTEHLVGAAGALVEYVRTSQGELPRHVRTFDRRRRGGELVLDGAAVRNLEILRDSSGERTGSLARVLDQTVTPMGSRLLRDWLVRPLGDAVAAAPEHHHLGDDRRQGQHQSDPSPSTTQFRAIRLRPIRVRPIHRRPPLAVAREPTWADRCRRRGQSSSVGEKVKPPSRTARKATTTAGS